MRNLEWARSYLSNVGLLEELLKYASVSDSSVSSVVTPLEISQPISPDLVDLARLHTLVTQRKCLNVLELGSGFSSLVIAHALRQNSIKNERVLPENLRREFPWKLDSIDESEDWLNLTSSRIPPSLSAYVTFHHSTVSLGTFNDRPATYYRNIPNRAYDLIYVDGPSQYAPETSDLLGFNTANSGRMPMSADALRIEHFLQAGALVLFDGRAANAKFFELNVQKNWKKMVSKKFDQTLFIEKSGSLGKHNDAFLRFWGKIYF